MPQVVLSLSEPQAPAAISPRPDLPGPLCQSPLVHTGPRKLPTLLLWPCLPPSLLAEHRERSHVCLPVPRPCSYFSLWSLGFLPDRVLLTRFLEESFDLLKAFSMWPLDLFDLPLYPLGNPLGKKVEPVFIGEQGGTRRSEPEHTRVGVPPGCL